ncbi:MAG: FAD:protein FMN transferase [Treponema sp.]|jgi:thiamine biosynthesis lipoprotein|nr:FAD:protein FMN transferase [Treponema sp.]
MEKISILIWIFFPVCLLLACTEPPQAQAELVLGTICSINLYEQGSPQIYETLFSRLREIELTMSATKADTTVDRINKNAGIRPVPVPLDLMEVLEQALRYAALSEGAFDPTIGPLVQRWAIGSEYPRIPEALEIEETLSLINWQDVVIDREVATVFLRRSGMALDLGAIAKGYAADEVAGILQKAGIKGAIIDLGGNIFAYGTKQQGEPWRIGIQNPLSTRGAYLGILAVQHKSIVTSGVYERYAEIDGKRYHHILSTQDGYPVSNGLLSVTIIADHSIDADALSTAAFALGYEKGRALVESVDHAEAIFIFEDKRIRSTPGALAWFTLKDPQFNLIPETAARGL